LCPQLQEGQELGQVDETFGFPPLLNSQFLTSVLTVEQIVQAFVHSLRKLEAFQISGELELDENLLRHADPFAASRRLSILHGQPRLQERHRRIRRIRVPSAWIELFLFTEGSQKGASRLDTAAGQQPPSLHSSLFAPDRDPTIATGVEAEVAVLMGLLGKP
jgi:hypothetical protein